MPVLCSGGAVRRQSQSLETGLGPRQGRVIPVASRPPRLTPCAARRAHSALIGLNNKCASWPTGPARAWPPGNAWQRLAAPPQGGGAASAASGGSVSRQRASGSVAGRGRPRSLAPASIRVRATRPDPLIGVANKRVSARCKDRRSVFVGGSYSRYALVARTRVVATFPFTLAGLAPGRLAAGRSSSGPGRRAKRPNGPQCPRRRCRPTPPLLVVLSASPCSPTRCSARARTALGAQLRPAPPPRGHALHVPAAGVVGDSRGVADEEVSPIAASSCLGPPALSLPATRCGARQERAQPGRARRSAQRPRRVSESRGDEMVGVGGGSDGLPR